MRRSLVETRIEWPRGRFWRPGEPITLDHADGTATTYRLRGVMRDHDPNSTHATVFLEPISTVEVDVPYPNENPASAAS